MEDYRSLTRTSTQFMEISFQANRPLEELCFIELPFYGQKIRLSDAMRFMTDKARKSMHNIYTALYYIYMVVVRECSYILVAGSVASELNFLQIFWICELNKSKLQQCLNKCTIKTLILMIW